MLGGMRSGALPRRSVSSDGRFCTSRELRQALVEFYADEPSGSSTSNEGLRKVGYLGRLVA